MYCSYIFPLFFTTPHHTLHFSLFIFTQPRAELPPLEEQMRLLHYREWSISALCAKFKFPAAVTVCLYIPLSITTLLSLPHLFPLLFSHHFSAFFAVSYSNRPQPSCSSSGITSSTLLLDTIPVVCCMYLNPSLCSPSLSIFCCTPLTLKLIFFLTSLTPSFLLVSLYPLFFTVTV